MFGSYRGTYRGEERAQIRQEFREHHVPEYIKNEIEPLGKFLFGKQEIVALDVGCNKGVWSKALIQRFPNQVKRIYMVDPSEENYNNIIDQTDNILFDQEDFAVLTAMLLAVGDRPGTVEFYTNDHGSPIGSVFPHIVAGEHTLEGMGRLETVVRVPMQNIDNIINVHGISNVDVLKIDIEGNELNAILGARESIDAGKIETILFEFGCHQVESRTFFRDFYELLKPRGYNFYKIDGLHLYDVPEYGYYLENHTTCYNFVASKI